MKERIQVVDDEAEVRSLLRDILIVQGYQVVVDSVDGKEAFEQYQELKPDLVLLDIAMPVCDGIKAAQDILSFDPEAKIIMLSARGDRETVINSLGLGVSAFVLKPFKTQKLLYEIEKALKH